jgi:TolB-like protein
MSESPNQAVFLSYAREDAGVARRIADALRSCGIEVWFDENELRGGDAWDAKIKQQIRECALFVPLISAQTQARPKGYFRREWKLAVDCTHDLADGIAFLLPVAIDDVKEREAMVPEEFLKVQWTRLPAGATSGDFCSRVKTLLTQPAVTRRLANGRTPAAVQPNVISQPSRSSRALVWIAVAVVLLGLGAWRWFGQGGAAASAGPIKSIAVMPLKNYAGDAAQDYFVDGITDLLIGELSNISGFEVKSLTTSLNFKNSKKSASEIGRELKVDALVEGTVQREGDQVLVNVQLIETRSDRHLWRNKYVRDLKEVLRMKSELTQAIAAEIRVKLTPQEQTRLASTRQRKPQAMENYLKGRHLLNASTEAEFERAITFFQRALQIEPDYADAYVGLARVYTTLSSAFRAPLTVMPQARASVLEALQRDKDLAEAHQQLGHVKLWFDYDFKGAEKDYQRALEISPNLALAHDGLAMLSLAHGKMAAAIAQEEKAFQLDPFSTWIGMQFPWTLFIAGDYRRAIQQGLEVLALQKDNHLANGFVALAHAHAGEAEKAIRILVPLCGLKESSPLMPAFLAYVYALAGREAEARRTLAEVEGIAKTNYICNYEIAVVYVALHENDAAFKWLRQALRDRADCMPFTKVDPRLVPLRGDPRFKELLKDIGFEP